MSPDHHVDDSVNILDNDPPAPDCFSSVRTILDGASLAHALEGETQEGEDMLGCLAVILCPDF